MTVVDELKKTIKMMNGKVTEASVNIQLELVKSLINNSHMAQGTINDSVEKINVSIAVSDYSVRKKLLYDVITAYSQKR
jgi:hypothetical protein